MKRKRSASASAWCCRSLLLAVAALLLTGAPAHAGEGRMRIGVLSVDTVLANLRSWQQVQAQLQEQTREAQARLEAKQKEIDRIRSEMDYFKPDSRDHEVRRAQLAEQHKEYARLSEQLRTDIARRAREAHEAVIEQIAEAARDYAVANGLDVVVDARSVFYVAGGADISLKVASAMNKRYKEKAPETVPGTMEKR
jgi:Skp family chaperone for outer membrane proteins